MDAGRCRGRLASIFTTGPARSPRFRNVHDGPSDIVSAVTPPTY